ncbi:MAG: outer membrane beta-barrel protein [Nitrospiraceae bacterium]
MMPRWRRLAGWLCIWVLLSGVAAAQAQEPRFGFTTDLGLLSGSPDGTKFALSFGLDYYVDRSLSFGLLTLFTPASDLNTYGFAAAAKYHFRLNRVNLVPFAGLGFIHMSLDTGGPPRVDASDTSHWIPLGITAEYPVTSGVALSTTVMVNLHAIRLSPLERDDTSVAALFGLRFGP